MGTGKTLLLVREAHIYQHLFPDNPIYANITLKGIKNFVPLTSAKQLFEINHSCFMGLDEAWHMADSRKGTSVLNDTLGMLMINSRKLDWWVCLTEQYYTQVDLRIRYITEIWSEPMYNDFTEFIYIPYYTKEGYLFDEDSYYAPNLYDFYDSGEPPLTLDIEDLKEQYDYYIAKRKGQKTRTQYSTRPATTEQERKWMANLKTRN
ncbi:MAG: hypothetical protein NWF01_08780 [Candidatus Bathyarchaeota archaeon]|nr:hypothetical protein [Candidatus Bathyarchaeota archaeon]